MKLLSDKSSRTELIWVIKFATSQVCACGFAVEKFLNAYLFVCEDASQ